MTDHAVPAGQRRLLEQLGVDIDPELLSLALTHRSWAYEHGGVPHNERLEFLGDSILGQAITIELYRRFPDSTEGELAKRRAGVVSTVALAEVARAIGLGEHILLGKGEAASGGAGKASILADTMEALFGAAFLSAGHRASADLVLRLVGPLLDDPGRTGAALDPKTALQEVAAALGMGAPAYELEATGPDHARTFAARVRIDGEVVAEGTGTSKKVAEMAAALAAHGRLTAEAAAAAPGA
ncbi:ribonuclease III [Agrococcus sediminis]|uniref:Ribonuclease 3 n=1 Tax=Agrococcus sediminis TaxID=2599924 RepID=A0A5M8QAN7_9MICO|nr:ribonuclease III [Agrococcus sediminis]KAA6433055.1 ribonuclease III [Agrococcus sediminis]RWR20317.1 ribonuclease III [Agrococcus lahaulensis]